MAVMSEKEMDQQDQHENDPNTEEVVSRVQKAIANAFTEEPKEERDPKKEGSIPKAGKGSPRTKRPNAKAKKHEPTGEERIDSFLDDIPKDENTTYEEYKTDPRTNGPEKKPRTVKVSFTVYDHNGEPQDYTKTVNDKESELSLGLLSEKSGQEYVIRDPESTQPIFNTQNLFSPLEEMYLSESEKDIIKKHVASHTRDRIEKYYLSDSPNKARSFSSAAVADGYKSQFMRTFGADYQQFREQNSESANKLMEVLGLKLSGDSWTPAFSMMKREDGAEIPVLHFENVGKRGAKNLQTAFEKRGMFCRYEDHTGIFTAGVRDGLPFLTKGTLRVPTDMDFNEALSAFSEAQIEAVRSGAVNDSREESGILKTVADSTIQSKTPQIEYSYSKDNERYAAAYLKSMGINCGMKDTLPNLRSHMMQIGETEIINGEHKGEFVPFVMIGQITKEEFRNTEDKLKMLDLSFFHDQSAEILYVACSPEGRPGFTNPELFREVELKELKDSYLKAGAHTVGIIEAKNLVKNDTFGSRSIRKEILSGYREQTRLNSLNTQRENGVDPIKARFIARQSERRMGRSPEKFFSKEFRENAMKTRTRLLTGIKDVDIKRATMKKAEKVR